MARRIDGASKFKLWFKGLDYDPDTTRLANDIARASRSLSQNVVKLQGDLRSFVNDLEKKGKKKRSTTRRIFGWLKILFNALGVICAIVAPIAAPGVSQVFQLASALWTAAAELCGLEIDESTFLTIPTSTVQVNE